MKSKHVNMERLFGCLIIKVKKSLLTHRKSWTTGINLHSEVIRGAERGKGTMIDNGSSGCGML